MELGSTTMTCLPTNGRPRRSDARSTDFHVTVVRRRDCITMQTRSIVSWMLKWGLNKACMFSQLEFLLQLVVFSRCTQNDTIRHRLCHSDVKTRSCHDCSNIWNVLHRVNSLRNWITFIVQLDVEPLWWSTFHPVSAWMLPTDIQCEQSGALKWRVLVSSSWRLMRCD